jgi:hypothetical protein
VTGETRPTGLTPRRRPRWMQSMWSYPFPGFHRPLSRGRCGGGTRVGSIVSWKRHQPSRTVPHNVGDGRIVRVSRTASGYDSQVTSWPAWQGFAFDPGAHDVPEQLMLRSGSRCVVVGLRRPRVRRRLTWGVRIPRVRWRLTRGGVKPSSEAETSRCGAWPSSGVEVCPRGTAAGCLVGCYGFLGRGLFSAPGCDYVECDL